MGTDYDTLTRDWLNQLSKLSLNTINFVDPSKPNPDAETMIPLVQSMYRRLGAMLLGLNLSLFNTTSNAPPLQATVKTQDTRIFMDKTAFDIILAFALYARQRSYALPRMP